MIKLDKIKLKCKEKDGMIKMKTNIGYKLFEMDTEGRLFPLFIDKKTEYKVGEWVKAINPGKQTGFALRPGIHVGKGLCDAPWLKSLDGTNKGCYKSQRSKKWKRVWCEVIYNSTNCYDDEVKKLPKKCFVDKIPESGYYHFNEGGRCTWVITSDIKINKILTEDERNKILNDLGYDEVAAFAKYKSAMEKRARRKVA